MELLVTGKNLDVTPRDRDYIEKKLATLQRHFKSLPILVLQIVLAEEKTKAVYGGLLLPKRPKEAAWNYSSPEKIWTSHHETEIT